MKKLEKNFWSELEKTSTKIILDKPNFKKIVDTKYIKSLRKKMGYTQQVFANVLGVSLKTVEKWEQNVNKLTGPTARLMYLINNNDDLVNQIYSTEIVHSAITTKIEKVEVSFDEFINNNFEFTVCSYQSMPNVIISDKTIMNNEILSIENSEGGMICQDKKELQYLTC